MVWLFLVFVLFCLQRINEFFCSERVDPVVLLFLAVPVVMIMSMFLFVFGLDVE